MNNDQENFIVAESAKLYLKYGIRSVTMDDVARELAISKKTIYKYVENKSELVHRSVQYIFEQVSSAMQEVSATSDNAIDELFNIDSKIEEFLKPQQTSAKFQLKKYYPASWKWLENAQRSTIVNQTRTNVENGMAQGLYRSDLNPEYVSYMYFGRMMALNDEELVPTAMCESPDFAREHLIYHIHGIASEKGLAYLEKKLKTQK